MQTRDISFKRHRFPPRIVSHAVWLYTRFPLSLRLVEEMLLERGIVVSYETIRCWARKFGPDYARRLRRKAPAQMMCGIWTRVCREASTAMWEPSCTEDEGRSLETDRQG